MDKDPSVITLFEQSEKLSYIEYGIEDPDQFNQQIDQISETYGKEVISIGRNYFRTTQFVGIIQLDDYDIQILPKIEKPIDISSEENVEIASTNLLSMLAIANGFPEHLLLSKKMKEQKANWFELLINIYAIELLRVLNLGHYREYSLIEETSGYLKGKWLLSKQMTQGDLYPTKFLVNYDVFSNDILLNQIFLFVVLRLQKLSRNKENRKLLGELRRSLAGVQALKEVRHIVSEVEFNRLNNHFKDIFEFSKMFIEGESFFLRTGKRHGFSFLIDMNQLFEKFVSEIIFKYGKVIFPNIGDLKIDLQGKINKRYLLRENESNSSLIRIKPDILVQSLETNQIELIIDAKYKHIIEDSKTFGISENDIHQMIAYALVHKCNKVILIYPKYFQTDLITRYFIVEGQSISICIATLDLHRPMDNMDNLLGQFGSIIQAAMVTGEMYVKAK